jgi:hypothetical protein
VLPTYSDLVEISLSLNFTGSDALALAVEHLSGSAETSTLESSVIAGVTHSTLGVTETMFQNFAVRVIHNGTTSRHHARHLATNATASGANQTAPLIGVSFELSASLASTGCAPLLVDAYICLCANSEGEWNGDLPHSL